MGLLVYLVWRTLKLMPRTKPGAPDDYNVSEALRRTRDEEVEAISEEAYRGAYRLLSDHRDLLDEIAERLLAKELIEREEIQAIMDRERATDGMPAEVSERPSGEAAGALVTKPPEDE